MSVKNMEVVEVIDLLKQRYTRERRKLHVITQLFQEAAVVQLIVWLYEEFCN